MPCYKIFARKKRRLTNSTQNTPGCGLFPLPASSMESLGPPPTVRLREPHYLRLNRCNHRSGLDTHAAACCEGHRCIESRPISTFSLCPSRTFTTRKKRILFVKCRFNVC